MAERKNAGYLTAEEAATAAMRAALPKSAQFEYAGAIYEQDGQFYYTDPQSSGETDNIKVKVSYPKGTKLTGLYHTHPEGDDSEFFSPDDIDISTKFKLPYYMGNYTNGSINVFRPGESKTRRSRGGRGRRSTGELIGNIADMEKRMTEQPNAEQAPRRGLMAPQATGTPAAGGEPGQEDSNVSPEEQAQYDQFVTNGMELMYAEEAVPKFLEALKGDGNPVEGLANSLATLVMRLEDSAGKGGAEISGDVKMHGATELLEQMVELAEQAGIHEFTEKDMESALYLAFDIYRSTRQEQGQLPEEDIAQDMQAVLQAEKQGTLDQILPGITEYAQQAPKPEGGQPPSGGRRGLMQQ